MGAHGASSTLTLTGRAALSSAATSIWGHPLAGHGAASAQLATQRSTRRMRSKPLGTRWMDRGAMCRYTAFVP